MCQDALCRALSPPTDNNTDLNLWDVDKLTAALLNSILIKQICIHPLQEQP